MKISPKENKSEYSEDLKDVCSINTGTPLRSDLVESIMFINKQFPVTTCITIYDKH